MRGVAAQSCLKTIGAVSLSDSFLSLSLSLFVNTTKLLTDYMLIDLKKKSKKKVRLPPAEASGSRYHHQPSAEALDWLPSSQRRFSSYCVI